MKKIILIIAIIALLAAPALAFPPTPPGSGGGTSLPSQTGNNGKYLTTDGSNASWGAVSSGGKVCKTITNPSTADTHLLFDIVQSNRTITKVSGISYGGTSAAFKLYDAGTGAGNTEINSTAVTAATTVTDSSALTYAIHAGDAIYLRVTAVTGVVTQLMACYEY